MTAVALYSGLSTQATVDTVKMLVERLRVRSSSLAKRISGLDGSVQLDSGQVRTLSMLISDIDAVEEMLTAYTVAEAMAEAAPTAPRSRSGHDAVTILPLLAAPPSPPPPPPPPVPAKAAPVPVEAQDDEEDEEDDDDEPPAHARPFEAAEIPPADDAQPTRTYAYDKRIIFHNADQARLFMEECRWPSGVTCVHCGGKSSCYSKRTKSYFCNGCKQTFNVRSGTLMYKSKLDSHKWATLIGESSKEIRSDDSKNTKLDSYKDVAARVGVSEQAVKDVIAKIRAVTGPQWLERMIERIIGVWQGAR